MDEDFVQDYVDDLTEIGVLNTIDSLTAAASVREDALAWGLKVDDPNTWRSLLLAMASFKDLAIKFGFDGRVAIAAAGISQNYIDAKAMEENGQ